MRRFAIPAPLFGYRASKARAHAPEYVAFKEKVRLLANAAGVPLDCREARIRVLIRWRMAARIDGKNVYAAIEDGLFLQDRGVAAGLWSRIENSGEERAEVEVEVAREI